jgi:hypothetical protein
LLFLDPGSEIRDPRSGIRDPRSGIRDPGWVKIRIRDKHAGSATLLKSHNFFGVAIVCNDIKKEEFKP